MPVVQNAGDVGLIFTNPAVQIVSLPRTDWWFADGVIPAANVLEHVENPTVGQVYAGAQVSAGQPYTLVAKSAGFTPGANRYIFDSQIGRFVLGISSASFYGVNSNGTWTNQSGIFPDTSVHIWFVTTTGSGTGGQAYLDNVAIGSAFALNVGVAVGGTTRWRSAYDNTANANWGNAVTRAAVYNIALNATQRLALYTSMLNN